MSHKKDPDVEKLPKGRVSRRGFMRGMGIGGAVGSGILQTESEAEPQAAAAKVAGPDAVPITLQINGKPFNLKVEPRVTLLDALRDRLDMTGAKNVCDRSVCGSCTVLMAGKVVYACGVLAIDAQGKPIQTIEGLAAGDRLHPIETAFVRNDAQQCGFCTPGFVMAAKGFLDRHPSPTYEQVKAGLSGNICRCGTYMGLRKAVLEVSKEMKGGKNA